VVKYFVAAQALKFFSLPGPPRRFYRDVLGRHFGARMRSQAGLTKDYIDRSILFLQLCRRFDIIRDGMHVLEIGSGWTHYYAVFLRLLYDVRLTLVDISDNRQFEAFVSFFSHVQPVIDIGFELTPEETERARRTLRAILDTRSFPELYQLLGCEYVIDPSGVHAAVPDKGSYDLVFSFHVQEHVFRGVVLDHVNHSAELLRPGGFQIHQIGIDDHLAHYDNSMSPKSYLRYSDLTWKLWFENQVQYHNRLQRSDWINIFERSGMVLRYEQAETCSIDGLKVNPLFAHLDKQDLMCTILTLVLQKP
jgi:hypothetical protein